MSFFNNKIKYKTKKSLDNVSFEIKKGESVAFFGKNGAGKSTLLKIITGVTYPSDGIVRVNGRIDVYKRQVWICGAKNTGVYRK